MSVFWEGNGFFCSVKPVKTWQPSKFAERKNYPRWSDEELPTTYSPFSYY